MLFFSMNMFFSVIAFFFLVLYQNSVVISSLCLTDKLNRIKVPIKHPSRWFWTTEATWLVYYCYSFKPISKYSTHCSHDQHLMHSFFLSYFLSYSPLPPLFLLCFVHADDFQLLRHHSVTSASALVINSSLSSPSQIQRPPLLLLHLQPLTYTLLSPALSDLSIMSRLFKHAAATPSSCFLSHLLSIFLQRLLSL